MAVLLIKSIPHNACYSSSFVVVFEVLEQSSYHFRMPFISVSASLWQSCNDRRRPYEGPSLAPATQRRGAIPEECAKSARPFERASDAALRLTVLSVRGAVCKWPMLSGDTIFMVILTEKHRPSMDKRNLHTQHSTVPHQEAATIGAMRSQ